MQAQAQQVIELCLEQGFALAGIASATRSAYSTQFEEWLDEGKQGEMAWMTRNVDVRIDPTHLLEGARSVICVADRYGQLEEPALKANHGKIARYARGKDYHTTMKKRLRIVCDALRALFPDESFRACVDTAPVFEREFAARSGIGSIGKHTLLLEQGVGSWMLLGVIVTTANLKATDASVIDPCSSCTRCIDACPTDAITPWELDARRCISYLTIEHRSEIDEDFHQEIGEWIFGCDICQEVCPHNQPTEVGSTAKVNSAYAPTLESLDIADVLRWDEESRRNAFKGSSMKRAKLQMMRRNAVIVAGNILAKEENTTLRELLVEIAEKDEDQMVQGTALRCLKNLQ